MLAIPFLVICTLVIAISYVKPDVVLLLKKQYQLERLRAQLASLERISLNIKSMQEQIATSQSDSESAMTDADFLRQIYFPASSDIERGIDQLNFLADQSGVTVVSVTVEDAKKTGLVPVIAEEVMQDSAGILIAKAVDGESVESDLVVPHRTYVPDTLGITIKTAGSYEATRDFYSRVVHAKRFFLPKELKLGKEQDQSAGAPTGAAAEKENLDILYSTLAVQFLLLPKVSIVSAIGDDVFEKTKLDFETLAMIRQNKQGVTPELPAANPLGKTNPFIK